MNHRRSVLKLMALGIAAYAAAPVFAATEIDVYHSPE